MDAWRYAPLPPAASSTIFWNGLFSKFSSWNVSSPFKKTGQIRQETLYGITSLPAEQASPTRLLEMLRSYWGIENGLHYPRDVALHEDETRFTKHAAVHIMSIINNMILALIAKTVHPFAPTARRYFATNLDDALALLS